MSMARKPKGKTKTERWYVRPLMTVLTMPRVIRMIIAIIPALAAVFLVQPVVDTLYLRFFFTTETRMIPALILAAVAVAMYFAGWVFVVGIPGEEPKITRGLIWYLSLSAAIILLGISRVLFIMAEYGTEV